MLELRRATLPLSCTSLAPWACCAALVLSAGIACSSTVLDGSSSSADVAGTWTLSPVVPDLPCPPQRDGFAIDQVGQDLVFMFDPTGFARATLSGRSVLFDYEFDTPSDDQRFRG